MFEGFSAIDKISSKSMEQDRVIDSLHEKFENQKKHYQPKAEDFLDEKGFDRNEVEKEIAQAKNLKEKWLQQNGDYEQKNKRISDVFEGIIVDEFCGEWMANQAEAFFSAEEDDFLRKVDCVIEFKPAEGETDREYLALGIDVTFSSDYATVDNKLSEVWKDVERSKKIPVKYVDTEHYKGSLEVCRIVIAADKETVFELARLYKHKDKSEIDNHPFLANIILQMKCQLEAYYNYAQQSGAKGDYLKHVTKTLSTFYRVWEEKEEFVKQQYDAVAASAVFKTIQSYCDSKLKQLEK